MALLRTVVGAALVLASPAGGCQPTGLPDYGCVMRVHTVPEEFRPEGTDALWVHAIVEARCDVQPRSHNLRLTLRQQEEESQVWRERNVGEYERLPTAAGRLYTITYQECIPGRWSLRTVVTGQDSRGAEYRFEIPEVRGRVRCG
ncbi:hypothetical protein [Spongiactinospora sp. TRM90649]|uniref:hypothetical protein n=1 Tax=Spongiactinospora sp. TRM90649 TaxID=3031114 RepID=UPI0023F749E0|nr:hypothetical protein [Spongiactinospora sp. TRM90649]MDF5759198.1 hypothetical protein [Spongiactinospora sp. TRM90649]